MFKSICQLSKMNYTKSKLENRFKKKTGREIKGEIVPVRIEREIQIK